ncbi:MAG TPA: biopolymer transporter ExbD [Holophagaceae bacterium]
MDARLRRDINVTPLVDIVLVLLIVFITLVPALPTALATVLPRPGPGREGPVLRLDLVASGALELDGRPIALADLPARVRASSGLVRLRVDPSLPFHRATEVLDLVKGVRPEARLSVVAAREGI